MYYSQDGQDEFLNENIFKNKKEGVFIDIGANDGITFSNTYFFEKSLGWTGICVEPLPKVFVQLQKNRSSICFNGCIAPEAGEMDFMAIEGYAEMLSGLTITYDERHWERIGREIKEHGGSSQVLKIPCKNLNKLLHENKISKVDYCSIDTEGGEFEILESIDFKANEIKVISVENNYDNVDLPKFMANQNYKLVKKIGQDEIYIKKKKLFIFF